MFEPGGEEKVAAAQTISADLGGRLGDRRPHLPAERGRRAFVGIEQKNPGMAEHDLAQYFTHRAGHGIGLETSLEPIDLRRDEMELRPGMTFCVEPGVYIPGFGGVKMEDDLIVTEGNPEIISHTTRDLVVI